MCVVRVSSVVIQERIIAADFFSSSNTTPTTIWPWRDSVRCRCPKTLVIPFKMNFQCYTSYLLLSWPEKNSIPLIFVLSSGRIVSYTIVHFAMSSSCRLQMCMISSGKTMNTQREKMNSWGQKWKCQQIDWSLDFFSYGLINSCSIIRFFVHISNKAMPYAEWVFDKSG